jgi:hypothetical protein
MSFGHRARIYNELGRWRLRPAATVRRSTRPCSRSGWPAPHRRSGSRRRRSPTRGPLARVEGGCLLCGSATRQCPLPWWPGRARRPSPTRCGRRSGPGTCPRLVCVTFICAWAWSTTSHAGPVISPRQRQCHAAFMPMCGRCVTSCCASEKGKPEHLAPCDLVDTFHRVCGAHRPGPTIRGGVAPPHRPGRLRGRTPAAGHAFVPTARRPSRLCSS